MKRSVSRSPPLTSSVVTRDSAPRREPIADPRVGAAQRDLVGHLVGDRRDRLGALPGEEELLDLARDVLEAHPVQQVDVEVRRPRAHPAEVEAEHHLHGQERLREVVVAR